jgi:hypothetical protein
VKSGRLSGIDILHRLSKLPSKDQDSIAEALLRAAVDSDDVRGLVNLRREMPAVPMRRLIDRIRSSKNIKHYIAYFSVPREGLHTDGLRRLFEKALGKRAIVSVNVKGCLGTLTMNADGRNRLQELARKTAITKRQLIDQIVAKGIGRHG